MTLCNMKSKEFQQIYNLRVQSRIRSLKNIVTHLVADLLKMLTGLTNGSQLSQLLQFDESATIRVTAFF